jgi:two-component system, chemotaxis family, response regulator Rcp1
MPLVTWVMNTLSGEPSSRSKDMSEHLKVLYVEDSSADAMLFEYAFKGKNFYSSLDIVQDGVEALAFLHKTGRYTEAVRPDLILLDLNLPKKNGYDVLREIKADDNLKNIPVIVYTSSRNPDDLKKCYQLKADGFANKPDDMCKAPDILKEAWNSIKAAAPVFVVAGATN